MKTVSIVGVGTGPDTLTREAAEAIAGAEMLFGARRLLSENAPAGIPAEPLYTPEAIAPAVASSEFSRFAVLVSGDTGFYSAALRLCTELTGCEIRVLPGISSLNYFFARVQRPWQSAALVSCHGRGANLVDTVRRNRETFALTGGNVRELAADLCAAGFGALAVTVGENLGLAEERILSGTAGEFAGEVFAPLSVLLAAPAPGRERRTPGIPDARFLREKGIPMTKQEVRATALAKLSIRPDETCWDIGTGTGSVAIELALQARRVYGIEPDSEALSLAEKNRRAFGAWNLRLIPGRAPETLAGLPKPDAVFIGGSGGEMKAILRTIAEISPEARICISAVTVENLSAALQTLRGLGYAPAVTQLSVSRGKTAGDLTLMQAQNPVWLITGERA